MAPFYTVKLLTLTHTPQSNNELHQALSDLVSSSWSYISLILFKHHPLYVQEHVSASKIRNKQTAQALKMFQSLTAVQNPGSFAKKS